LKLSKLMLIGLVLLTILSIGAVSAQSNDDALSAGSSADTISAVSFDKSIYVSDTGSDSGSGSQASPYATLNKAISEVNSSDVAVIYVGPGTFTGENNTNLQINLAHNNYNGSLTIIGDSKGGTIFDGDDEAPIIKAISADSLVTLINITFTHGKLDMGSAIRSSGTLFIDGCIFTENEATNLATVYQDKANNLTIVNSKFLYNKANQMADLYYSQNALITLVNNVFEGATVTSSYAYSPSCSIQTGKSIIKGNTFKDLSGSYYAAALHASYNNGNNVANITDNTFVNCTYTGSNGAIVFFQNAYLKNNNFINCSSTTTLLYSNTDFNSFVTFEDAEIDGTSFNLKANVTDDMGNLVKNAKVVFTIDGKNVGSASTGNDGVATLSVKKLLDNGDYTISGTQAYSSENVFDVTVVNGTATVDYDHSPAEVWVSPNGDDTNGDGSQSNPFLTLKHALDNGTASTVDLTVHVMDGLYNGTSNIGLSYSNVGKITIVGESYGNVVIDAEHAKSGWSGASIFTFGQNLEATLINLTFINCDGNPVSAYTLTMMGNVVINSGTIRVQSGGDGAVIDNLKVINGTAQAINAYNLALTNSLFENCDGKTSTGLLWLASNGDNVIYLVNNIFRNNTIAGYSGGAAYYAQGDLISMDNLFESNTVTGTTSNIAYASGNNILSVGDTFIDNDVPSYIAQYRSSGNNPTEIVVEDITFINNRASTNGAGLVTTGAKIKGATFINNTALGNGGAIYLLNHGKTSQVCEMSIEDVTFENNTAASGSDIFIAPSSGNNVFANLTDLTITANDLNVTQLSDILTVTVSHPSGAIIGGGEVTFYFDGNVIGKSSLINENATLEYVGFENNTVYKFSAVYEYATENDTYVNGTVRTNITSALDSIEYYVSDSLGSDENGTGTKDNPFKSISKALSEGYTKSTNITVYVLEGNYTGTLNTNLRIPTTVDVTIKGEGVNKTVVSDTEADYFITALAGNKKLTLTDMTLNRAARDTQSAIYVEEGANVEIDNVAFIDGQGNYGGAINTLGTLVIKNSYFNGNGYADRSKRANAYYGGAIYNDGVLIIDNTTFEADHAGRLSEIATQGTLYMNNSMIIDSIGAYSMNMDLVAIGAFGGQKGEIIIENTLFMVTNRTVDELSDRVYDPARSLTCLAIGSCDYAVIINCTFVDEGAKFSPYVFGGINSWNLAGGGITIVPGDIEVYNSTFRNVQAVNVFYTRTDSTTLQSNRVFDGCVFDNVEYLMAVLNNGNFSIAIHNSVISSDDIAKIGFASGKTIEMDISDNWWMSNNATYKNATISTTNYISNSVLKLNEISSEIVNPENYLILTLNATNKTGVLQDVTLAFKSFDGENVSDYEGSLAPRDFTISAVNGTLEQLNGTIENAIVIPFEGIDNNGYYVEATVDNQTVNFTVETPLVKFNSNISLEVDDTTTVDGLTAIATVNDDATGEITFTLSNGDSYDVEIINGTATLVLDNIAAGDYNITAIYGGDYVYKGNETKSSFTVTGIIISADDIKVAYKDPNAELVASVVDENGNPLVVNLNVVFNGENFTVMTDSDGQVNIPVGNLTPGKYNAIFSYQGIRKTASVNALVTVTKSATSIDAADVKIAYKDPKGEIVATIINEHGKGLAVNLNVEFNGENFTVRTDSNGQAVIPIGNLTPGKYNAKISYKGSSNYKASSANVLVTVTKAATSIDASDVKIAYKDPNGEIVATIVSEHGKGLAVNLNVEFNGENFTVRTDSNGQAVIPVGNLTPGKYNAKISYKGSINYKASSANALVTVTKAATSIDASDVKIAYKDPNGEIVATIISEHGKGLAVNLNVEFNGKTYTVRTDSNGQAVIPVGNLTPGTYDAKISYKGSSNYKASSAAIKVVVTKAATSIDAGDVNIAYRDPTGELVATVTNEHGKTLIVTVNIELNGKTYSVRTDANGQAVLSLYDVTPGTYDAKISYKGSNNYEGFTTTAKVVVTKAATSIDVSDVNIAYRDPTGELVATVTNEHGKTLIVTVNIELNGKTYSVRTDANGQAVLSLYDVTPGTYNAKISYKGSNNYEGFTTTAKVVVTKSDTIISAPDVSVAYGDPDGKLVSTIVNEHGKPLVVNMKVELDGKTYSARSDSNGQINVSTADLAPGSYAAKISYKGSSNYNSASTTANITVKA